MDNEQLKVMTLIQMWVENMLSIERLESLGRATPQTIERVRKQNHRMRMQLLNLAEQVSEDGAAFIRRALTPEGLADLKNLHEQSRPYEYARFGDPDQ